MGRKIQCRSEPLRGPLLCDAAEKHFNILLSVFQRFPSLLISLIIIALLHIPLRSVRNFNGRVIRWMPRFARLRRR